MNMAGIYITKFTDLKLTGEEEPEPSYGLRVADDYNSTYSNLMEYNDLIGKSPKEILALALDMDGDAVEIIDAAKENFDGIEIAGVFCKWEELNTTD